MARESRASLAPKESRHTQQELDDALNEGFRVTLDGETWHELLVGDVTSTHIRELRAQAKMGFGTLMQLMAEDPDSDVVATFVWLSRLVNGDPVPLGDVVVTYQQMLSQDFDLQGTEDPPAAVDKAAKEVGPPEE